ncbi:MAG: response regulator [Acidobacteriota bacterium]
MSTILIIDDDQAVLQAYGCLLRRRGHRVILVRDPDEVRGSPDPLRDVDLVILDQRMPRTTGIELLRTLRRARAPRGGAAPAVLLVSAYLNEEIRREALELGVAEVIEKPVDPELLLRRVRESLAGRGDHAP